MNQPKSPERPKVERHGDITVITFTAGTMHDVENQIANELQGNTEGAGDSHLLLDFTNVKRLSSCELGTLITLHKKLIRSGGRLTLFNLSARLFELFSLTRLDTLLGICRESAIVETDPSADDQIQ